MAMIRMWHGRLIVTFWFVTKQSMAQQGPCMQSIYGLAEPTTRPTPRNLFFPHRFYNPKLKRTRPSLAQSQHKVYFQYQQCDIQNSNSPISSHKVHFQYIFCYKPIYSTKIILLDSIRKTLSKLVLESNMRAFTFTLFTWIRNLPRPCFESSNLQPEEPPINFKA